MIATNKLGVVLATAIDRDGKTALRLLVPTGREGEFVIFRSAERYDSPTDRELQSDYDVCVNNLKLATVHDEPLDDRESVPSVPPRTPAQAKILDSVEDLVKEALEAGYDGEEGAAYVMYRGRGLTADEAADKIARGDY